MPKLIKMSPGVVYRPRTELSYETLYKLKRFCSENDLRFGQALANATPSADLFYLEDDQLERRIKEYINATGKG